MRTEDVETVHQSGVHVEAFQTSQTEASETPFWPRDRLRRWVKADEDVLLVAENDGQIIGYFLSHLHETTGTAYVENIFVKENYRRQGVGESLFREGIERIADRGGRYISVLTKTDNEKMIKFLKKLNFNKGDEFVWMDKIID